MPRILIIAVWFGPLPDYFPQWLISCKFNPSVDWLLVTDGQVSSHAIPVNVHVRRMSMAEFGIAVSSAAGVPVRLDRPYKACDLKPLYGCLTHLVAGKWDFWAHCDLDMLFGDLSAFLKPDLLRLHDRIFGLGHFSLYRNNDLANRFYRRLLPGIDFHQIFADSRSHGFDEHNGVNKLWRHYGGRFYEDESVVADIDPHVRRIRRISSTCNAENFRYQIFGFDQGHIRRFHWQRGRMHVQEFMYMHFQKRHFSRAPMPPDIDRFWLTPEGFVPLHQNEEVNLNTIKSANSASGDMTFREMIYLARRAISIKFKSEGLW